MSTIASEAPVFVPATVACSILGSYPAKLKQLVRDGAIRVAPALPGSHPRYRLSDVQRIAEAGGLAIEQTVAGSSDVSGRTDTNESGE